MCTSQLWNSSAKSVLPTYESFTGHWLLFSISSAGYRFHSKCKQFFCTKLILPQERWVLWQKLAFLCKTYPAYIHAKITFKQHCTKCYTLNSVALSNVENYVLTTKQAYTQPVVSVKRLRLKNHFANTKMLWAAVVIIRILFCRKNSPIYNNRVGTLRSYEEGNTLSHSKAEGNVSLLRQCT